jgi:hypothetical protein
VRFYLDCSFIYGSKVEKLLSDRHCLEIVR